MVSNSVGVDRCTLWKRRDLAQWMFLKLGPLQIVKISWHECQATFSLLVSVILMCQKFGRVHYIKISL